MGVSALPWRHRGLAAREELNSTTYIGERLGEDQKVDGLIRGSWRLKNITMTTRLQGRMPTLVNCIRDYEYTSAGRRDEVRYFVPMVRI